MSWKSDTKSLISTYQGLDNYAKYSDLEEFLQWVSAEGHNEITGIIRSSDNNKEWCINQLIRWRKDNVSPWILFTYAHDFTTSGSSILNQHLSKGSMPPGNVVYFLYGRGIELYLKAFLVARGNTAGDIRLKYGHNLTQLLKEARRIKLGQFVPLSKVEIRTVQNLSVSYSDKQYEYPVLGGLSRPDHRIVKNILSNMDSGLKEYCRNITESKRFNESHA